MEPGDLHDIDMWARRREYLKLLQDRMHQLEQETWTDRYIQLCHEAMFFYQLVRYFSWACPCE